MNRSMRRGRTPKSLVAYGFTLIELMVGLAVGALVLLAVLVAWGISVGTTNYTLDAARLNHDLRATMQIITQDLRRADAGSVEFAGDASCVSFTVSPRPSTIAAGICTGASPDDPECWAVRGFRLTGTELETYVSRETASPGDVCTDPDLDDSWYSIYGGMAAGTFIVDNFSAVCSFRCLDLAEVAEGEEPQEVIGGGNVACSQPSRCGAASGFGSWVEILNVTLTLGGEVQVSGRPKQLLLQDTVTVRNNHVLLE